MLCHLEIAVERCVSQNALWWYHPTQHTQMYTVPVREVSVSNLKICRRALHCRKVSEVESQLLRASLDIMFADPFAVKCAASVHCSLFVSAVPSLPCATSFTAPATINLPLPLHFHANINTNDTMTDPPDKAAPKASTALTIRRSAWIGSPISFSIRNTQI